MRYPLTVAECYVIGALLGDGSFRYYPPKGYGICLWTKDKDFMLEFSSALWTITEERQHLKFYKTKPKVYYYMNKYRIDWNGKRVLAVFTHLKEKFKRKIDRLGKKRLAAFLKGLYDAEGSYWHNANHHRVTITNTTPGIIELAEKALSVMGLKSSTYVHHFLNPKYKERYDLRVIGKYNVQKFFRWIRPFKRKVPTTSILPKLNKLKKQRYAFNFTAVVERAH